ncbi:type II secretion system F family protein [Lysobacter korlensis]|uniref:Type II secretion system F family protein n=1 Tax=Lysobacter korlensis TaxID=553636 RepID=A0ABV6RW31_9GAMM
MTVALGLLGGVGVLLLASPLLWPRDGRAQPARTRRTSRLQGRLAGAGLSQTTPAVFVLVSVIVGIAAGAVTFAGTALPALAVVVAAFATLFPNVVVGWRIRSRQRMNRLAWPDVVDHLVGATRAGLGLPESLSALADTGPTQFRGHFRDFARDYESTGLFGVALDDLKARLADPIADRILETLRMTREVGGTELPSVLRSLSALLRQEQALRAEVEARQSWIVNAARIGVAAPWVVLMLLSTRPEAAAAYQSPSGLSLLAVGVVVTLLAYRIMIRIGRLPDQRRWGG